jgi:hypothetical protein
MGLTAEQMNIAETIAARVDRFVQAGKSQATILGEMVDYMAGFKQLLDAGVVQEAASRHPGFRQFAKILERTARGIHSGAIPVPGGRAAARRGSATSEAGRLAAEIDVRMRQLAEQGVPPSAIIERMATYVVHLQKIWTSTGDDELAALCREYPGFHDYAVLMEDAAEAERRKPTRPNDGLPELPDGLKEQLSSLLSGAANLDSPCSMRPARRRRQPGWRRMAGVTPNGRPTWRASQPRCRARPFRSARAILSCRRFTALLVVSSSSRRAPSNRDVVQSPPCCHWAKMAVFAIMR